MPKLTLLALSLALLAASAGAQTVADPYLPGMRWSHGADLAQPWIPREVCLAGSEGHVWAGQAMDHPGVALFAGSPGTTPPPLVQVPLPGAIGLVQVAAGDELDELYSAAQFQAPGGLRATEVRRTSAHAAGPSWLRTLSPAVLGGVELGLSRDGSRLFVARFDPTAGGGPRVHLDRLDPATGATLAAKSFAAPALRGVELDEAGDRVLLALGTSLHLLDADLNTLLEIGPTASTEAFDLSGDGSAIAYGQLGEARLWREAAGTWQAAEIVLNPGPWLPTALDLDHAGATLGLGWWDSQAGLSITFQLWDLAGGVKLHDVLQSTPGTGLQNFPQEVRVSDDGQRMAVGAWGSGGPDPQLLVLDRDQPLPVFSTYLPGSALALDLDPSGDRVAVAAKASHANQFATTGYVQLHDLGERDALSLAPLTAPGAFHFSSRHPGSQLTLFLFGAALPPTPFPGIAGQLQVDPSQPYNLLGAPADLSGRADLVGQIPPDPSYAGLTLTAQALFAGPFGLAFSSRSMLLTIL